MLIESSAITVKSTLARMLVNFRIDALDREEIALDIIEFIALRLNDADDAHIFNLGLFVRTNLAAFLVNRLNYAVLHQRLTATALAAREGLTPFLKSIDLRCGRGGASA